MLVIFTVFVGLALVACGVLWYVAEHAAFSDE